MASRKDIYEEDPTGRIINDIYDDINLRKEGWEETRDIDLYDDSLPKFEIEFWEEDFNALLHEIGIDFQTSFDEIPLDRLEGIFDRFEVKSQELDDEASLIDIDPIPLYAAGNNIPELELKRLGYTLGKIGELGRYYILLPNIDFARGFWLGKFEKAIDESNDSLIVEVKEDIKAYDPEIVEDEIAIITANCYKETPGDVSKTPKTM